MQCTNHPIQGVLREIQSLKLRTAPTNPFIERTPKEIGMSNFFDQLISDRAKNLGNMIILWEESIGDFWVKSNH